MNRNGNRHGMNWIRQEKRLAIYMRDGMACMYCGLSIEEGAQLSLDHIEPRSRDGSNSESNLVTSCVKCNSSRGNRPVEDFANAVAEYIDRDITGSDILASILSNTRQSLGKYMVEAKKLINRRGSAARVINAKLR